MLLKILDSSANKLTSAAKSSSKTAIRTADLASLAILHSDLQELVYRGEIVEVSRYDVRYYPYRRS